MGNCMKKQSMETWDGEDWTFEFPAAGDGGEHEKVEEERLVGDKAGFTKEVKIKITKKKLEQLLGRVDVQGMSIDQLLSQLMSASDHHELRYRHWKPDLESIPEVFDI